jgi:hypothetical protein
MPLLIESLEIIKGIPSDSTIYTRRVLEEIYRVPGIAQLHPGMLRGQKPGIPQAAIKGLSSSRGRPGGENNICGEIPIQGAEPIRNPGPDTRSTG